MNDDEHPDRQPGEGESGTERWLAEGYANEIRRQGVVMKFPAIDQPDPPLHEPVETEQEIRRRRRQWIRLGIRAALWILGGMILIEQNAEPLAAAWVLIILATSPLQWPR